MTDPEQNPHNYTNKMKPKRMKQENKNNVFLFILAKDVQVLLFTLSHLSLGSFSMTEGLDKSIKKEFSIQSCSKEITKKGELQLEY